MSRAAAGSGSVVAGPPSSGALFVEKHSVKLELGWSRVKVQKDHVERSRKPLLAQDQCLCCPIAVVMSRCGHAPARTKTRHQQKQGHLWHRRHEQRPQSRWRNVADGERQSQALRRSSSVLYLPRSRFPRRQEAAWKTGLEAVVETMHLRLQLQKDRACIPGLRETGTRRSLGDCGLEHIRAAPGAYR